MKNLDRITIILVGVLAVSLTVSLLLFLINGTDKHRQVLFFPEYRSSECIGEQRLLPTKPTTEQEIELLVKEILLGPFDVNSAAVLPQESILQTLMLREDNLFIDFSIHVIFQESKSRLSFGEALDCVRKTITFNYPQIEKIVFTVNGEQPKIDQTDSTK
ncbi:MAG TPA: GerMN domain-containing protein [Cryomorphaceae bacterium]|nr:GerMN domain-containing protein [Cryomorphaceae bacterium]